MFDIKVYLFEKIYVNKWWGTKFDKNSVNLLFIDDNDMPVADNLRKSGFKVVKRKDIKNIDDGDVLKSQIIFVDFNGVGRSVSTQHQGAGLAKNLKERFGKSKFIVLYTAEAVLPTDTIFNTILNSVDAYLKKDADETEFSEVINVAFKKLR